MKKYGLVLCAMLALAVAALGQASTAIVQTYTTSGTGAQPATPTGPTSSFVIDLRAGYTTHNLSWTIGTNAPATCTVAVDSSVDGHTWVAGGIITAQPCTTAGALGSAVTATAANYAWIHVTALTYSGSVSPVIITYTAINPLIGRNGGGAFGTVNPAIAGMIGVYASTGNKISGSYSINPGAVGPTTNPECYVDGVANANLAACITALGGQGVIYSNIPEDITSQIFAQFQGEVFLGNDLSSGADCVNESTNAFNGDCWVTEIPLSITNRVRIKGVGAASNGNVGSGTTITFGNLFPVALGAPAAPTLSCGATGGNLSNGTYIVALNEVNNAYGGTTVPKTPMFSKAWFGVVSCANNGSVQQISFAMPAKLYPSNYASTVLDFSPQDLAVYSTTSPGSVTSGITTSGSGSVVILTNGAGAWGANFGKGLPIIVTGCSGGSGTFNSTGNASGDWIASGGGGTSSTLTYKASGTGSATSCAVYAEGVPIENAGGTDMTCPAGSTPGSIDPNACNGGTQTTTSWAGGTVYINSIPSTTAAARWTPPAGGVDLSNPMIVMAKGDTTSAAGNAFDALLEDLSLSGSPNSTSNSVPVTNEPHVAVWNPITQENGGADTIDLLGGFVDAMVYSEAPNSHWVRLNSGSTQGPSQTAPFYGFVCDSNRYNMACTRELRDSTLAPHCQGCGSTPWLTGILQTGNAATPNNAPSVGDLHTECGSSPCSGQMVTNNADLFAYNIASTPNGDAALHIGANAGHVCGFDIKGTTIGGSAYAVIDDENGVNLANPTSPYRAVSYCTDLDIAKFTVHSSLLIPSLAGLTSNGTSTIGYDTTAKNTHIPMNGADALAVGEAAAITANVIPKSASSAYSGQVASSLSDNGSTVFTAEAIATTSSLSTGTSPPAPAAGTSGSMIAIQGTTPTGIVAGDTGWWGNSTNGCFDLINNGTDIGCAFGGTTTQYGVAVGGAAGAAMQFTAAGAANMPLVGAGASANPAYSTIGWLASATQWGIPYMSTATQMSTTTALTANCAIKAGSAAAPSCSSITDAGTDVVTTEPILGGNTKVLSGQGTTTSASLAAFTTNSLAMPALPISTSRYGFCDLEWEVSNTSGTVVLGLSTSATLTGLQILDSKTYYTTGTPVQFLPVAAVATATSTAFTGNLTAPGATTFYLTHFGFSVITNGSNAQTITVVGQISGGYTLTLNTGSACGWLP